MPTTTINLRCFVPALCRSFKDVGPSNLEHLMDQEERRQRLRYAFDSANAIVDLEGLPFSAESKALQELVINGELSFDEAVQEVLWQAKIRPAREQ